MTDPRDRQHVVTLEATAGPPWSALCGKQLHVSSVEFTGRLKDDREQCTACSHAYADAVNPTKRTVTTSSRPAPKRMDLPRPID